MAAGYSIAKFSQNQTGKTSINSITANTTLTTYEGTYEIDATAGSITVTLPLVGSANKGQFMEFKRIDNSANTVRIIPVSGQTIDGETNTGGIFLFNKNDGIKTRSNGNSASDITADNRGSVGNSKGYLYATRNAVQSVGINQAFLFNNVKVIQGSGISYNPVNGLITISKPGNYRIKAHPGKLSASPTFVDAAVGVYDNTLGQFIDDSIAAFTAPADSNWDTYAKNVVETVVSITTTPKSFYIAISSIQDGVAPITILSISFAPTLLATVEVEEISTQATVLNTVLSSKRNKGALQSNTAGSLILFENAEGSQGFQYSAGLFTLLAGIETECEAQLLLGVDATAYADYEFWNYTSNTSLGGSRGSIYGSDRTGWGSSASLARLKITPTSNIQVGIKIITCSGTGSFIPSGSYCFIKQVGSSAVGSFTPATSITNGFAGAVPAPLAGQEKSVLTNAGWFGQKVTQIFNNTVGPLPITSGSFTTSGGKLTIIASGTIYANNTGLLGFSIRLDGAIVGTCQSRGNRSLPTQYVVVNGISAGSHTISFTLLTANGDSNTDDFYNAIVIETLN